MSELFEDFIEFCKAVILRWSNLVTSGVIAVAWLCYERFAGKPIPLGIFISILSVGFLVAFFQAWREQYAKNKCVLAGEILSLVWNEANAAPGKTLVFLQARIINNGSPTMVNSYELQAVLADGTKLNGTSLYLRDGVELHSETETTRITKVIYEQTVSPIAQGGQAAGWICFELPAKRDRIRRKDTNIILTFRDARGRKYSANSRATGASPGLKYYPGAGSVPETRSA